MNSDELAAEIVMRHGTHVPRRACDDFRRVDKSSRHSYTAKSTREFHFQSILNVLRTMFSSASFLTNASDRLVGNRYSGYSRYNKENKPHLGKRMSENEKSMNF